MSFCHSVEKIMSLCLSVENFCHYNKNLILSFCRKNMSLCLSVENFYHYNKNVILSKKHVILFLILQPRLCKTTKNGDKKVKNPLFCRPLKIFN